MKGHNTFKVKTGEVTGNGRKIYLRASFLVYLFVVNFTTFFSN
jgi:hypothetical protein